MGSTKKDLDKFTHNRIRKEEKATMALVRNLAFVLEKVREYLQDESKLDRLVRFFEGSDGNPSSSRDQTPPACCKWTGRHCDKIYVELAGEFARGEPFVLLMKASDDDKLVLAAGNFPPQEESRFEEWQLKAVKEMACFTSSKVLKTLRGIVGRCSDRCRVEGDELCISPDKKLMRWCCTLEGEFDADVRFSVAKFLLDNARVWTDPSHCVL